MSDAVAPAALLEFRNVTVLRGGRAALRDLNLRVDAGEHLAVLGPNGSGKSTLLKAITRECYPVVREDSWLRILGRERWNVFELRTHLGIVSNDLAAACALDVPVEEVVLSGFFSSLGLSSHHAVDATMRETAREALAMLDATHLTGRAMTQLSSGEARRVLIARALVHAPQTLVFDEPSTSLDLAAHRELRATLQRLAAHGIGIVLVTHDLSDLIPEIERIVFLSEGRVVADGSRNELLNPPALERLFGVSVEIAARDGLLYAW
ncbi:MAG: ABC transporter ATP-binding protein [Vulcanimicrobiaceae bacterium]